MNSVPYANIVGSIMYLMVCMHLNIAYAMNNVSSFMSNVGRAH